MLSEIIMLTIVILSVSGLIYKAYKAKKQKERDLSVEQYARERHGFSATKKLGVFWIDTVHKKWLLSDWDSFEVHDFSEIIDAEIIEDGTKFKSQHGVFRSVVGGAMFGLTGAVVGASTAKKAELVNNLGVNIYTKNIARPVETISLITTETKTDSVKYRLAMEQAREIAATVDAIVASNQSSPKTE